jgi:hypothetical protein
MSTEDNQFPCAAEPLRVACNFCFVICPGGDKATQRKDIKTVLEIGR